MKLDQTFRWHRSDGMADNPHCLPRGAARRRIIEGRPVGVEIQRVEPALSTTKRLVETTTDVVRLQQHNPDADFTGRVEHDSIPTPPFISRMMEVVEFPDGGHARTAHLRKGGYAQCMHSIGIHRFHEFVHGFTPCPKVLTVTGKSFATTTQATLERVAVGIDEAGKQRRAWMRGALVRTAIDGGNPPVIGELDSNARLKPTVNPRQLRLDASGGH